MVIISVILVIAAVVWTLSRVLSRNPQGEAEAHKAVSSGWRSWEGGKARYIAVGLVMMTAGSVLAMLFLSDASSSAVRVGRLDAARDMKEETTTLPLAHLVPDSTKSNRLSEGSLFDPSKREYHLLVHGTSGYYLFRTLKTVPGIPMGNLSLIFVPDTEVAGGEFNPRVPKEVQP
ncbi:MAG: hypothetical protein LAO30_25915 [Acidobacteriia bacterium]|nr:hypothetical protein [Terriglobia bacterium]